MLMTIGTTIALLLLLSVPFPFPVSQGHPDDATDNSLTRRTYVSVDEEREQYRSLGICLNKPASGIAVCGSVEDRTVSDLVHLKQSSCRCDRDCFGYGDCCIDRVSYGAGADDVTEWRCREVNVPNWISPRIPIYVHQKCPGAWEDEHVRGMCEMEAQVRERMRLHFDHLQDLPVKSDQTGRIYRNIYCAVCNGDTRIAKWETYIYCNGDSSTSSSDVASEPMDFSQAVYVPRTMDYRRVRIGDRLRNCKIHVKNFNAGNLTLDVGARLCKPVIRGCPEHTDMRTRRMCAAYSSYVYKRSILGSAREVYNNFHCAICNGLSVSDIVCEDPYYPILRGTSTLGMLFDFNFDGGLEEVGSFSPCRLSRGEVWDPIFKTCQPFVCGSLFQRLGPRCVPKNETDETGMENECPKIVLDSEHFIVENDGTVFINHSKKILAKEDYEVYKQENNVIVQIAVCVDDTHLLPYSKVHSWLSIITLTISIVCLVLHLSAYAIIKKLRNTPGKVLMCLAASLLCGHLCLLLGPLFTKLFWLCYLNGVLTHFGYLSAFAWMSVMAFDIHGTFSVSQTRTSRKSTIFIKYSLYALLSVVFLTVLSVALDNSLPEGSQFRPKYGDDLCWFNNRTGLLVFFVVPATMLLIANIVLFSATAFSIRKVSRQTKMVGNFSDKVRYFLYLKLAVVLGLTWTLGLIAGISRLDAFWYPFIILNGLQGALIFVSFTVKRNIFHMLAVKLRIRSEKYHLEKRGGVKAAMYNSLSNLTTLQTSLSQIPTSSGTPEILKSVRKINPESTIEKHKT